MVADNWMAVCVQALIFCGPAQWAAQGVYVGRPYLYGLGAMGKKGVTKALQIFHKELDITMALCGENNNENIGRHNLIRISL